MTAEQERENAIEIACVFDRCGAVVKLLRMRTDPHDPSKRRLMVDEHRFYGDAPIDLCPTSGQWFPLSDDIRQHLADTAAWIDRHEIEQRANKRIASASEKDAGRRPHSRAPRPSGSMWFGSRRPGPVESDAPASDERDPPVTGPNNRSPRRPLGYLGDDRYSDR